MSDTTKCLIIGSGPAGYTAAIYAARANMAPIIYEGLQPGGQLTTTSEVENFPGYPDGVMGAQLMEDLRKQAARFEADIRTGVISKVDFSSRPFHATADDGTEIQAYTVIIATGASARYLGLEDEVRYSGLGRIGMCYMRRIFLSRPYCRSRRWRRHRMRRGILSEWPCKKGISYCTKRLPSRLESNAEARP